MGRRGVLRQRVAVNEGESCMRLSVVVDEGGGGGAMGSETECCC